MLMYFAHETGVPHAEASNVNGWLIAAGLVLVIIVALWLDARQKKK